MNVRRIPSIPRGLSAALAVLCLSQIPSASAHICGPSEIFMTPGNSRPYAIIADVSESQPTDYSVVSNSDATISTVSPAAPFSKRVAGVFTITSLKVGTNTIVMH